LLRRQNMQLERLFKVLVVHGVVLTAGVVGCEPLGTPAEGKSTADATPEAARSADESDGSTPNSMFDSGDIVVASDATPDVARMPDSMFAANVVATQDAADATNDAPDAEGVGSWLSWT
jgi:hypothetical protein